MNELFEQLQDDTRSFWQNNSAVRCLDSMPSPAVFFREYVATSTPVIISGGTSGRWKASQSWDDLDSLADENPELEVTVDFTPDGRGDCVVNVGTGFSPDVGSDGGGDGCKEEEESAYGGATTTPIAAATGVFVKPEERRMKFESFVRLLSAAAASRRCGDGDGSISNDSNSSNGTDSGGVPYLSHQVGGE